jgi:predicted MPP superfamily phosphohydrolase
LQKLANAAQDLNTQELAFVIQLGDFIDRDFKSFDAVLSLYEQIETPTYHVLGNHDFVVQQEEKSQVAAKLGLEKGYYDFTYHSWRFIVLDGNDLSFYTVSEKDEKYDEVETLFQQITSEGRPNAQKWNGGLSREQLAWLKTTLDRAFKQNEQVILFCHFPAFPPDMHNVWNDIELVTLLDTYPNVVAYLSGHNHAGIYGEKNGTHYLTLQGMVETEATPAYAIIEVYTDHLNVIGKGRESNRKLLLK